MPSFMHMNPTEMLQANSEGTITTSPALRTVDNQFKDRTQLGVPFICL